MSHAATTELRLQHRYSGRMHAEEEDAEEEACGGESMRRRKHVEEEACGGENMRRKHAEEKTLGGRKRVSQIQG